MREIFWKISNSNTLFGFLHDNMEGSVIGMVEPVNESRDEELDSSGRSS